MKQLLHLQDIDRYMEIVHPVSSWAAGVYIIVTFNVFYS